MLILVFDKENNIMRKIIFAFTVLLLLVSPLGLASTSEATEANGKDITVPDDYDKIQWAISNATEGDTIYVRSGVYRENVMVDKSNLTLVGEDSYNTIIEGQGTGHAITLRAQDATITGFTIKNSDSKVYGGIYVAGSSGSNITYNRITNNGYGILLFASACNVVSHNVLTSNHIYAILVSNSSNNAVSYNFLCNNSRGILLSRATDNKITKNTASSHSDYGILLSSSTRNIVVGNNFTSNAMYGIELSSSSGNWVLVNVASENQYGIWLEYSNNNTVLGNTVSNNCKGMWLHQSDNNTFFHNNFVENIQQVYDTSWNVSMVPPSINFWDDGYPSGGNWWSDYDGTDTGRDAIGEAPYVIDVNNRDRYPLVSEFTAFDAGIYGGVSFCVDVVSNSSVSDFCFNPSSGAFLNFTVTGGSVGFCRVSIPKQLLWVEAGGWIVLVDELSVVPSVFESDNFTYLYFTYSHSSKTVHIEGTAVISEFSSTVTSQLLLIVCFVAVILMKRRYVGKKHTSLIRRFCLLEKTSRKL